MISRFAAVALLAAFTVAFAPRPVLADEPKRDATVELLDKLRKPVDLPQDDLRLQELADLLTDRFGVSTIVNATAFAATGTANAAEEMVKMPRVKGLALGTVLRQILTEKNATVLVRKGYVEIVPIQHAAKEAKIAGADEEGTIRLAQPLVSAIYKEKPLNEALADLAEEHELTVVVAPQAGDAKTGFITARLLNVPADKAIELLALQADLRAVKKGNSFFVTSKDHAAEMFNESLERQRQKIDLERLREAPPAAPAPPAK